MSEQEELNSDILEVIDNSFGNQFQLLYNRLNNLFSCERSSLELDSYKLIQDKVQFDQEKKNQLESLEKLEQKIKETQIKVESLYVSEENIIDLNIGGTHQITTTRSTLMKYPDSALAAMFSGRHKITMHNNKAFIDRDGETFCKMISFLRNGKLPAFVNQEQEQQFIDELDY